MRVTHTQFHTSEHTMHSETGRNKCNNIRLHDLH